MKDVPAVVGDRGGPGGYGAVEILFHLISVYIAGMDACSCPCVWVVEVGGRRTRDIGVYHGSHRAAGEHHGRGAECG